MQLFLLINILHNSYQVSKRATPLLPNHYLSDLRETKVYQEALEEGREEGGLSAKKSLILRQLNLKLGSIPLKVEQKIKQLNPNQLDNLALALLDFSDLEDLHQWLN